MKKSNDAHSIVAMRNIAANPGPRLVMMVDLPLRYSPRVYHECVFILTHHAALGVLPTALALLALSFLLVLTADVTIYLLTSLFLLLKPSNGLSYIFGIDLVSPVSFLLR